MIPTVTISVPRKIKDARPVADIVMQQIDRAQAAAAQIESQAKTLASAAQAMLAAAAKFQALHDTGMARHNRDIAKLALDIARKVLAQEISERHYKIEEIIHAALDSLPRASGEINIRLNPADEATCRQTIESNAQLLPNMKLTADPKLGPAECVIETSAGTVESFIETNLAHIGEALAGAHA